MAYSPYTGKLFDDLGVAITSLGDGGTENGLAVAMVATDFVFSSVNSTTAQLASGATFNGNAETVINQQAVSILLVADQQVTLTVRQWIGVSGNNGTGQISAWTFVVPAGTGFSRAFVANGNYISFHVTNNGLATTTTLNLNVAYGTLPAATNLGNTPVSLSEINGFALSGDPLGSVPMFEPPTTLFYEDFVSALDFTNKWVAVNSGAWTIAGGSATYPTTAVATSVTTLPTFSIQSSQYFVPAFVVKLEAVAATGTGRFWGLGTAATTPAINSLAQEGAGFQVDTTGVLQAVTYTGGAKTVIATLVRPTDNAFHRYSLIFRAAQTIWVLDGVEVARVSNLNIATQTVSGHLSYFATGSTIVGTPQTVASAFGIGDRSRLHTYIADPTYPWRRALVTALGALSVASRPNIASTATGSNVTPAATSGTFLAANTARQGYKVWNDSNVDVLVNEGGTASATSYTFRVNAGGYYETTTGFVFGGAITCIGVVGSTPTAAGSGALRITDYS